jgi:hypothetical protein
MTHPVTSISALTACVCVCGRLGACAGILFMRVLVIVGMAVLDFVYACVCVRATSIAELTG